MVAHDFRTLAVEECHLNNIGVPDWQIVISLHQCDDALAYYDGTPT